MTAEGAVSQVPAHFSEILVGTVKSAARLITIFFYMPITLSVISHTNVSFYHKHVNRHYHTAIMHEELQEQKLMKIFCSLVGCVWPRLYRCQTSVSSR